MTDAFGQGQDYDMVTCEFDAHGCLSRPPIFLDTGRAVTYLDLRQLTASFIPSRPSDIHYFREGSDPQDPIFSHTYLVASSEHSSVDDVDRYLMRPGIHYVQYAYLLNGGRWRLWSYTILPDAWRCKGSLILPRPMSEWLRLRNVAGGGRFPHSCPSCRQPAYIGFTSVECSAACRPSWGH